MYSSQLYWSSSTDQSGRRVQGEVLPSEVHDWCWTGTADCWSFSLWQARLPPLDLCRYGPGLARRKRNLVSARDGLKKPTATLGVCVGGFLLLQIFNICCHSNTYLVQFLSLFASFVLILFMCCQLTWKVRTLALLWWLRSTLLAQSLSVWILLKTWQVSYFLPHLPGFGSVWDRFNWAASHFRLRFASNLWPRCCTFQSYSFLQHQKSGNLLF